MAKGYKIANHFEIVCPAGEPRREQEGKPTMGDYLVVIGSVNAQQYQEVRLALFRDHSCMVKVLRLTDDVVTPRGDYVPDSEVDDYLTRLLGVNPSEVRGVIMHEAAWIDDDNVFNKLVDWFPNLLERRVVRPDRQVEYV